MPTQVDAQLANPCCDPTSQSPASCLSTEITQAPNAPNSAKSTRDATGLQNNSTMKPLHMNLFKRYLNRLFEQYKLAALSG